MFGYEITKKTDTEEVIQEKKVEKKQTKDIMLQFAEAFGDFGEYEIDKEEEVRMYQELQSIDYFQTYLRAQIAFDMKQYFAATTDSQRDIIKGRIARTAYMRSRMSERKDVEVSTTKMKGLRYRK